MPRIVEIETSEAMKAPGVRAVVEGRDFPFTFGTAIKDQPFLAIDRVRYVGEPVVAVAAETEAACDGCPSKDPSEVRRAARSFRPTGSPQRRISTGSSRSGTIPKLRAPRLFLGRMSPSFEHTSSEIWRRALRRQTRSSRTSSAPTPYPTRPLNLTSRSPSTYRLTNHYTIWSSTDRPYLLSRELAGALGIPTDHIRYIVPYVGGAFGGKNTLIAEAIAVALARFTKGRPVKVVFSREEELTATQVRVGAFMKLKTGVKKDGTFTARKADIIWDSGAYISNSNGVAIRGAYTIFGPYRIPNIELVSRLVYTNKEISGSYRGYGTTQVTWACESQMDRIAHKLGIDSLELRLKNAYVEGDRYINGQAAARCWVEGNHRESNPGNRMGEGGSSPPLRQSVVEKEWLSFSKGR